jgi:hypothetical protein
MTRALKFRDPGHDVASLGSCGRGRFPQSTGERVAPDRLRAGFQVVDLPEGALAIPIAAIILVIFTYSLLTRLAHLI